jgi:hypothetical protein
VRADLVLPSLLSVYRLGQGTAQWIICARCGVLTAVLSRRRRDPCAPSPRPNCNTLRFRVAGVHRTERGPDNGFQGQVASRRSIRRSCHGVHRTTLETPPLRIFVRVVDRAIVHGNASSRDCPNVSWKSRSVSCHFPTRRSERTMPSSSSC